MVLVMKSDRPPPVALVPGLTSPCGEGGTFHRFELEPGLDRNPTLVGWEVRPEPTDIRGHLTVTHKARRQPTFDRPYPDTAVRYWREAAEGPSGVGPKVVIGNGAS
jgi:hypothetical protein